jgi:cytochrome c
MAKARGDKAVDRTKRMDGARRAGWRVLAVTAAICLVPLASEARADDLPGSNLFSSQCGTCHVISPTPEPRQGPNLYGVIGRPAGKLKGFKYSPALARAKHTWTRERLDAWLTDPAGLVPGTVMNYRQADATIRGTIIDYLAAAGGAAKSR